MQTSNLVRRHPLVEFALGVIFVVSLACLPSEVSASAESNVRLSEKPAELSVTASPDCAELQKLVNRTYNFKPSKLSAAERTAKSNEMDKVWSLVDSDPDRYLPCLKAAIAERKSDTFFRFNASNLLFKHDRSLETKELMIDTYAGADLADISLQYWLPYVAAFGQEGLDVTKAGETWLRFPDPTYYLPQHGTRPINKSVGALAIFGSMDESIAGPELARLASEESNDFRSIVIWLLANQATAESEKAARELSGKLPKSFAERVLRDVNEPKLVEPRVGKPKTTREEFIKALNDLLGDKPDDWIRLTTENPDGEKDMVVVLMAEDIPILRRVRRAYAAMATPHSPEWYTSFTQIINTLRARSKSSAKR